MGEWITFDATVYGVPMAVNMAQLAVVYFEEQDEEVHGSMRTKRNAVNRAARPLEAHCVVIESFRR